MNQESLAFRYGECQDMGLKFEHSKLTRIDKTKGYSKENCIWKRSDKNG